MQTLVALLLLVPFVFAQHPCGKTPIRPELESRFRSGKIVGGNPAIPGSWPWQISLRRDDDKYHTCGGVILCRNIVVTAAHCVDDDAQEPGIFRVDVGRYYKDASSPELRMHNVEKIVVHPRWTPFTRDNDIALLKLSTNIVYSNHSQPICLPNRDARVGEVGHFTGWGRTMGSGWDGLLKQAALPVLAEDTCRNWMGPLVSSNMICTGKPAGDVSGCMGDSGGPLVIKDQGTNSWMLVGLVGWGRGTCSGVNTASVFTRFRNYVVNGWINSQVQALGGCQ